MKELENIVVAAGRTHSVDELVRNDGVTEIVGLAGSAWAIYALATAQRIGGIHLFVCSDRDRAAYLSNDLIALTSNNVYFLPTGYKRSVQFGSEDASGSVQRTAALEVIISARNSKSNEPVLVCTYPEALAEKVADATAIEKHRINIAVGEKIDLALISELLEQEGFRKVDFVYEPGNYSVRGGIIDIFSYSHNKPCRIDLFGDEVESIRWFDAASQLSTERIQSVEIIPDMKRIEAKRVPLTEFAHGATYWADDLDGTLKKVDDIRRKMLSEAEEPSEVDKFVTSRRQLLDGATGARFYLRRSIKELPATACVEFATHPQPAFNKQYRLLAQNIAELVDDGYTTYILSENRIQNERLDNILSGEWADKKRKEVKYLLATLHEGFTDSTLRVAVYTDHQIFERYHRYKLQGEIDRSQAMTLAELNELKVGDYVTHIDHGVGKFGGIIRTNEGGQMKESVKLEYRDGDILLVNVHSLHRISKYNYLSDTPVRLHKLGTGLWQRMKNNAKAAVKEIARKLIALYAERKASGGFAFSPDTYLQTELEAGFEYEETADQVTAIEAVKSDMERSEPMDRLICGDVGFGKTEVAVRAAFKAAADSKQTAVLVPTTILSLQHYRTFSERMKGLPVKIEYLNRTRSAKDVRDIEQRISTGDIDILIGTQKILGKSLKFKSLGLLIVDEEQKFGVTAKEKLRELSIAVDTLTMTATPIPRTLQFSLMGARDLSVIATPPPNRQPIETEVHEYSEEIIKDAISSELERGGQVFFLHNNIASITGQAMRLRQMFPEARVEFVHGQMANTKDALEKVIMDFVYGEIDILVATTVVENGIDIPNANTIIINHAERFGLSELHQLRGRVGRSDRKGYCYLLTGSEEYLTNDAQRRLRAIEEFSDLGSGFNIAMQDLDIRGAGNLLGAEQSGFIADMGFETYQKVLAEAVAELRAEGIADPDHLLGEEVVAGTNATYLTDAHVETSDEAALADDYIGQTAEKIRLYRELDSLTTEAEITAFATRLEDRFGALPEAARILLDVVRLRRVAIEMGLERIKVKNGLAIVRFVPDPKSTYYQSPIFRNILKYATSHPSRFVLKQQGDLLSMTIRNIGSVADAVKLLREIQNSNL